MTATPTIVLRGADGVTRVVDVLLDNSYPTGGYALTAAQLGFGTNGVIFAVIGAYSKTAGWSVAWDYTNSKLMVFDGSGSANAANHQIANTTDVSAVTARIVVIGQGQG